MRVIMQSLETKHVAVTPETVRNVDPQGKKIEKKYDLCIYYPPCSNHQQTIQNVIASQSLWLVCNNFSKF